jgi:hypothetical protein
MIDEQTFEGRRENLAQANRLSPTFATLLEALNLHRGKGQQKATVEHVHVHSGGQAVVGVVEPPGVGIARNWRINAMQSQLPMHHGPRSARGPGKEPLDVLDKFTTPARRLQMAPRASSTDM